VRADRLGSATAANDSLELIRNGLLPGQPPLPVTEVAVEQGIDPGQDGPFLKPRLALGSDPGHEARLGIPQL
jgi:hypothetical protein